MTGNSRQFELGESVVPGVTQTGMLAASDIKIGDRIANRYRIMRLLGMGGMGVVYLARDEELDIEVALKLLRPELASRPEAFERFRQELLLARQVSSPHVVRIHDLVKHDQVWLISMDYVDGQSLESLLEKAGALSVEQALAIVRDLAEGLRAAHQRNVIHRDLKPANVLIDRQGRALITDFGIARSAGATGITGSGIIIGTPEYLSPEQAKAEPTDARSDLYELGLMLYEMLSGKLPFSGGTPAEMLAQRIVRSPPPLHTLKPELPRYVVRLCARLLELRPSHRFQSAEELLRALDTKNVPDGPTDWSFLKSKLPLALVAIALMTFVASWYLQTKAPAPITSTSDHAEQVLDWAVMPIEVAPELHPRFAQSGPLGLWLGERLSRANNRIGDVVRSTRALQLLGLQETALGSHRARVLSHLHARGSLEFQLGLDQGQVKLTGRLWQQGAPQAKAEKTIALQQDLDLPIALQQMTQEFAGALDINTHAVPRVEDAQFVAWSKLQHSDAPNASGAEPLNDPVLRFQLLQQLEHSGELAKAQTLARQWQNEMATAPSKTPDLASTLYAALLLGDAELAARRLAQMAKQTWSPSVDLIRARALAEAGQFDDALTLLNAVRVNDEWNVEAWWASGRYALMSGRAQVAMDEYLMQASVQAARLRDARMQDEIANTMGVAYRDLGQYPQAIQQLQMTVAMRRERNDQRALAIGLRNLASVHSRLGNSDESMAALTEAFGIVRQLGDDGMLANLLNELGVLAEENGDLKTALSRYREALGLQMRSGNPQWIGETQLNVGFAYSQLGENDNAIAYWNQAIASFESVEDLDGATRARQGFANSQISQGRWQESRLALERSILDSESLQLAEARAAGLLGKAELDRLEGRFGDSLRAAELATRLLKQRQDPRGIREGLLLQISVLLEQFDARGAEALLQELANAPIDNREQDAMFSIRKAHLALLKSDPKTALRETDRAKQLAESAASRALLMQAELLRLEALLADKQGAAAKTEAVRLQNTFDQYSNVPIRLMWLEARLALSHESGPALWNEVQSQMARLTRYGRAPWVYARVQARTDLPATVRDQARRAGTQAANDLAKEIPDASRAEYWQRIRAAGLMEAVSP